MMVFSIILMLVCMGEFLYICRIRRQMVQWLAFLKSLHKAPGGNAFVKGKGILADINFELNSVLKEGRRQLQRLQREENANQQLLTDLSHDVRTPLASLTGYLESLDSKSTKEQEEYIHVAYRKALDLQELIDMLFQWFKLASDEQRYQMQTLDINELTREILIEFIPVFEKKQVSFSAAIPDDEWFVKIDKMAYGRILNNLLSNAIKHGGCSLIEIAIERRKDRVLVLVSDNGAGIPQKEVPFLFERLYKCDPSRAESGNGLGLAIVRELTNAMSGEIRVQSIQGEKTTFFLELPLIVRKN